MDNRIVGETIDHATEALVVCAGLRVKGSAEAGVPAFSLARRTREATRGRRLRFDEFKVNPLNVELHVSYSPSSM